MNSNNNKSEQKNPVLPVVKTGNKVQIGLPVLCSYDDDDEEEEEQEQVPKLKNLNPDKSKPVEKARSGLLSLLPPPKSTQNPFLKTITSSTSSNQKNSSIETKEKSNLLIPRTVKSQPVNFFDIQNEKKSSTQKNATKQVVKKQKVSDIGFSKPRKIGIFGSYTDYEESDPDPFIENDEEHQTTDDCCGNCENPGHTHETNETSEHIHVKASATEFDREALVALCGSQGKKSKLESIEIKDVNAKEIVGDNKAELMKQITSDYKPPSNKDYFGSSSRKTHQITYLAKVAVERDQELKNTWAQSKFNRQQAKQRYGF